MSIQRIRSILYREANDVKKWIVETLRKSSDNLSQTIAKIYLNN